MEHIIDRDFVIIITRLFIALILSGLIGFEREINNHSAGFRTHILVGVGSCLMMILSTFGFISFIETYDNIRFDPARIPSYVISGIGFLGAGTIIVYGGTIKGLTTAASIWTVAGIGLVVGAGMYSVAIVTTFIILISLIFLNQIEKFFPRFKSSNIIEVVITQNFEINEVIRAIEKDNFIIRQVEIKKLEESNQRRVNVWTNVKQNNNLVSIFDELSSLEGVVKVTKKN